MPLAYPSRTKSSRRKQSSTVKNQSDHVLTRTCLCCILVENEFQQRVTVNLEHITSALRARGYRVTSQRKALLETIAGSHDRFTPATIHERVRRSYPTIGIVTVYRMLELLDQLELICRVLATDGCRTYLMRRPNGHSHHMVCSACVRVVYINSCDISLLERKLARHTGFKISGHLLEFEGLCRACLAAADNNASSGI